MSIWISCYLSICSVAPARLFIFGKAEILSHVGATHRDCIVLYLFAIYHKNVIIYIYKFVKSRIDKNNVCDVKYITTYTDLLYH